MQSDPSSSRTAVEPHAGLTAAERAVVEKYATVDDKLYMTVEEAVTLSRELAARVRTLEPAPALVVGVANGAFLPATVVARELGVPLEMIRIQQRGSIWKERLTRIPGVRPFFAFWFRIPGVRAPLAWAMGRLASLAEPSHHETDALEKAVAEGAAAEGAAAEGRAAEPPAADRPDAPRVVLVDDAVASGQTLQLATRLIREHMGADVVTAVLAFSEYREETTLQRPDLFIGRRLQHYPWSHNSPHYGRYQQWLAEHDLTSQTVDHEYDAAAA